MFSRSAYSTRSFRYPQNFMQEGASHLDLSGMPSIGTIAASRLDESRCLASVAAPAAIEFAIRTNRRAESAKPKNSSGSPRGTEGFFDGNSKKRCIVTCHTRAIPTSEVGEDETGPRSTRDNKRVGNADRRRRLIERPVQPLAKHANFSPSANATGTRFAGAKNHIRNINRRQNLFDIS
ncbi:hypothetical protein LGM89_25820 [Burkholderia sp. AU31624]|uniref:hypothetical protein n=1 Tax=unclassified Burkholderia TaxID=2613784 RepID=UPI001CF10D20|nr:MULTISPECIES: hypothetical protein [unclassified Burkholderia]MCA8063329.1 hypothetical protein [Burkholderia sp. AU38729]MCA8256698.1 hypothetical protein [Burkholderia sp. AU31624]